MSRSNDGLGLRIGIIGGGQLGKMMLLAAKAMGFYAAVLDPSPGCPAHSVCDFFIAAEYDDKKAIRLLSENVDILTYEFEHIDAETLLELELEGKKVYPTAGSLVIIQDKLIQKQALSKAGLPIPEFMSISSVGDIKKAAQRFGVPFILKTRTGGYDGKGNFVVETDDFDGAYEALGGGMVPLMAERLISFKYETSVLACRAENGEIAVYPVGLNIHHNNILNETRVPAPITDEAKKSAMKLANDVMEVFGGVGMFCVEIFVSDGADGEILHINEVAPRPHNSGHYSIEGCVTSQFEQHIRAITGLPLGDTSLLRPTVMRNILGEHGHDGAVEVVGAADVLKIKGAKLHIYGKEETRPKRKMGHITVTADTVEEAASLAGAALDRIKIISK